MASSNVDIILKVKDEATAKLRSVANDMGGIVGSFQRMSIALGGAGAAIAGIVTASSAATVLAKKYSELSESILNASKAAQVGATDFQVFQKAIVQAGGSSDDAAKVLNKLNTAMADSSPLLRQIGATGLSTWDTLLKVADAFQNTAVGNERHNAAMKLLGKDTDAVLAVLSQGSQKLLEFRQRLLDIGVVISDETLVRFARLDDAFDDLDLTMEAMRLQVAEFVLPALLGMFDILERLRIQVAVFVPTVIVLVDALRFLADSTDPRNWSNGKLEGLLETIKKDAIAVADAAVKAKVELASLKDLISQLGRPGSRGSGLGFGDKGGIELPNEWGMTSSDAKLRTKPRGKLKPSKPLEKAKEDLRTFSELVQETSADIMRGLSTIASFTESSITGVFQRLTDKTQTWGSALRSVFDGILQGVLTAIGQFLAEQATKAFIGLLGKLASFLFSNPIPGVVLAGVGDVGGNLGLRSGLPSQGGALSAQAAPTYNFNLSMISAKDLVQSIVSPTGPMRTANSRVFEIAAAS